MANSLYYQALASLLRAEIDWELDTIRVALIDTSLYTPDLDADQYLSDVPSGAIISSALVPNCAVSVTELGAVGDGDDVSFSGLSGATVGGLLVYQSTGDPATSRLIAWYDEGIGLPVLLSGQTVVIVWDNTDDRIIRLGPCLGSGGS